MPLNSCPDKIDTCRDLALFSVPFTFSCRCPLGEGVLRVLHFLGVSCLSASVGFAFVSRSRALGPTGVRIWEFES